MEGTCLPTSRELHQESGSFEPEGTQGIEVIRKYPRKWPDNRCFLSILYTIAILDD